MTPAEVMETAVLRVLYSHEEGEWLQNVRTEKGGVRVCVGVCVPAVYALCLEHLHPWVD